MSAKSWIFQANPKYYDIFSALNSLKEITWLVTRYKNEIHVGDTVYIWQSGNNAGIIAITKVISEPKLTTLEQPELKFILQDKIFKEKKLRVKLKIIKVLSIPIMKNKLKENKVLSKSYIIRSGMGTNFNLTNSEKNELKKLIV